MTIVNGRASWVRAGTTLLAGISARVRLHTCVVGSSGDSDDGLFVLKEMGTSILKTGHMYDCISPAH